MSTGGAQQLEGAMQQQALGVGGARLMLLTQTQLTFNIRLLILDGMPHLYPVCSCRTARAIHMPASCVKGPHQIPINPSAHSCQQYGLAQVHTARVHGHGANSMPASCMTGGHKPSPQPFRTAMPNSPQTPQHGWRRCMQPGRAASPTPSCLWASMAWASPPAWPRQPTGSCRTT